MDRAVDLLLAVAAAAPAEATAPALARACGLNRATAWRLLKTLQARGLVTVDEATGRYSIGLTAVELGNAAGPDALIAAAHPVLERTCAQTGETASLAVPGMDGLTYVDEVTPTAVVTASWLGRSVPVHATSTGKALLAFLPRRAGAAGAGRRADRVHRRPRSPTRRRWPPSWPRPGPAGTGCAPGELESSLYGVSAPVLDRAGRPLAVLSIWGPRDRVTRERFAELGATAVRAARQVAAARLAAAGTDGYLPAPAAVE